MTTTTKTTTTKNTTDKKQPTTTPTQKTVNEMIDKLKSAKLEMVQTKHIVQLFGFNDGGKFIRRHLRKNFQSAHDYNDPWVWKPTDKQLIEIVTYFVDMGLTDTKKRSITSSLGTNWDLTKITIK